MQSDGDGALERAKALIYSEERLIRAAADYQVSPDRMSFLRFVAGVLRLMDEFLDSTRAASDYVTTFSQVWSAWPSWGDDADVHETVEALQHYYERIQFFSSNAAHRRDEPLLFDERHLASLTRDAYQHLSESWLSLVRIHGS